MSVKSTVSSIAAYVLGLVLFLALASLPVLFIVGGVLVAEKILPWLMLLSFLALAFIILVLLPLTIARRTRSLAGLGFFISSYVFGLTGWFMGLLLTWTLWGGLAVIIGLFIFGIGVVPIAMLATLLNGMWLELTVLFVVVILTFGLRIAGMALAEAT